MYIHGGANLNGQAALYNGTALVAHSCALSLPFVYVGMNYRVNGFVFLASSILQESEDVNLGLHDQEVALKWLQANIESFAGDKGRVTIVVDSAGSVDVWAQIARQGAQQRALFQRAWMLSGAPGGLWPHCMRPTHFMQSRQNPGVVDEAA